MCSAATASIELFSLSELIISESAEKNKNKQNKSATIG